MKNRLFLKRPSKIGLPPGELVYVGDKASIPSTVSLMDYNDTHFEEKEVARIDDLFPCRDSQTISWINVNGLNDIQLISRLGDHFGIHTLILEDTVNTDQRPKMEDLEKIIHISLKMIYLAEDHHTVNAEQISLILGPRFVISFQEREGDVFKTIRERIRTHKGRIRKMGADYLAYALVDAIVDHYFLVFEVIGDEIESMEDEVLERPEPETVHKLHQMKRRLLFLRKSVWPVREIINGLLRVETALIKKQTHIYLRDVYDHSVEILDLMETMRDMNSGLFDMYLSSISNRMNEVMKVLTIIATIFIPLTFIAGIYGMNFEFMPELKWPWGYFAALGVMAAMSLIMVFFFKRKKWL